MSRSAELLELMDTLGGIKYRLSCADHMVLSVHMCVESGEFDSEIYADAIYGAYEYLHSIIDELSEVIVGLKQEGHGI